MTRRALDRFATAAGLVVAWVVFDVFVVAHGQGGRALGLLVRDTWGSARGIVETLHAATALLFAGVAVRVALRAGLFNLGAEGQIVVGSLASSMVLSRAPKAWPAGASMAAALLAAAIAGAAWAAAPALLRARRRVHEAITTALMSRVASLVAAIAIARSAAAPRPPGAADVAAVAAPPTSPLVPSLHGGGAGLAFLFALAAVIVAVSAERWTRIGREIGLAGAGEAACAAQQIPVRARLVQAMLASGALAALACSAAVLGGAAPPSPVLGDAGLLGIAVAVLGRGSAIGLVLAALLFGTLAQGGSAMGALVPPQMMDVLVAVVVAAVAFGDARARRALVGRPA